MDRHRASIFTGRSVSLAHNQQVCSAVHSFNGILLDRAQMWKMQLFCYWNQLRFLCCSFFSWAWFCAHARVWSISQSMYRTSWSKSPCFDVNKSLTHSPPYWSTPAVSIWSWREGERERGERVMASKKPATTKTSCPTSIKKKIEEMPSPFLCWSLIMMSRGCLLICFVVVGFFFFLCSRSVLVP